MNNLPEEIKNRFKKNIDLNKYQLEISNIKDLDEIKVNENIFINFEKINNIRRINKFHESVNNLLENNGVYISCAETLDERKKRVEGKAVFGFKNILFFIDFIYKRLIPKLPLFKNLYFIITKGHNRVLSKAEILGRLISCGFLIKDYFEYENILYILSEKYKEPDFNMDPSYGILFKMKRIGHRGKLIGVYKFRTMHPYSEYCQELIYKENKLASSGKIYNDYRATYWGKLMRKYWIDEIPMLINFFKGDLSLIGVRPISESYFSKYPEKLKKIRLKIKPGLIPPYYADLPKNFDEILTSEEKYILKKIANPLITDISYFIKASINIIFKGARST